MTRTVDPGLNRHRLRTAMRSARESSGLTQRQAAESLEWSLSKLIRVETGTVGVSVTDLRAMLHLYGINDPQAVADLEGAARGSKGASWWAQYRDVLSDSFAAYLGFETAASSLRCYQPIVVPGHLQTRDYASALLAPRVAPERSARFVDLRMERQERIFGNDSTETEFVLDELALRRRIGDPQVMKDQMEQLAAFSRRPGVKISVLPADFGAHYSTLGSFVLLGFPTDGDILYLEGATGSYTSGSDMDLLASYQECFETISSEAVQGEAATELIAGISHEYAQH
jgi:hypothetical protein